MSEPNKENPPPSDTAITPSAGSNGQHLPEQAKPVPPPAETNGQHLPEPTKPVPPPAKPARVPPRLPASRDPISRFRNQHNDDEEARMGFLDHLMELRRRMLVVIASAVICIIAALIAYEPVYGFLTYPIKAINDEYKKPKWNKLLEDAGIPAGSNVVRLTATEPLGTMMMVVWLGCCAGLVLASPIALYQIWAFVAPGLKREEKRAIKPILYGGIFFFLIGAYLSYQYLGPLTLIFFVWLDLSLKNQVLYTSERYMDLTITMMLISGALCEIPLVVAAFARLGIIEPKSLVKYWKYLTFGSVVLGMIVSPGNDIASMSAFSGLILGIYLVSIVMAYAFYRKPSDASTIESNGKNGAVK